MAIFKSGHTDSRNPMHPAEILRNSGKNGRFAGKHILVCITGSIAAVEDVKLIREFIRQ